ncbi:MAG: TIGR03936 family radical SAM-associated protein [Syntrophothermus sp.]
MGNEKTRIRIRFSKGDPLRFISHLDLTRAMERAVRRARLPIAFSQGFHPMPRIVYASALPVGTTSEAEYADFEFSRPVGAEEVAQRLNAVLPEGIQILDAAQVPLDSGALMAMIDLAEYQVEVSGQPALTRDQVQGAIRELLARRTVTVERKGKKGIKVFDLRPLIEEISWCGEDHGAHRIAMRLKMGNSGNARPEEIVDALGLPMVNASMHRTGLFIVQEGRPMSPIE